MPTRDADAQGTAFGRAGERPDPPRLQAGARFEKSGSAEDSGSSQMVPMRSVTPCNNPTLDKCAKPSVHFRYPQGGHLT